MEPIWLAVIASITTLAVTLLLPLLTKYMDNRNKEAEKQSLYTRADELEARAEARATEVARLLVISNADQAARATKASDTLLNVVKVTNDKLDIVHALVNSNMTAAMQSEFDATQRELAMMREVVDLKQKSGHQPSVEALAAIDATDAKLAELRKTLDERIRQAKLVEVQQENQRRTSAVTAAIAPGEPLKVEITGVPKEGPA